DAHSPVVRVPAGAADQWRDHGGPDRVVQSAEPEHAHGPHHHRALRARPDAVDAVHGDQHDGVRRRVADGNEFRQQLLHRDDPDEHGHGRRGRRRDAPARRMAAPPAVVHAGDRGLPSRISDGRRRRGPRGRRLPAARRRCGRRGERARPRCIIMTAMRRTILTLSLASAVFAQSGAAQTPAASPAPVAYANLNQLMRGVFYPAANVVFFPQFENPGDVKQDLDPSLSTDPLKATFGQWQAVENAALALAESTNLLLIPRMCSTGVPAPTTDPEWAKFVNEVRDAAMQA